MSWARNTSIRRSYSVDRKSTRLNSSHDQISYAVFCLKKKKRKVSVPGERKNTRLNSRHDKISYAASCETMSTLEIEIVAYYVEHTFTLSIVTIGYPR